MTQKWIRTFGLAALAGGLLLGQTSPGAGGAERHARRLDRLAVVLSLADAQKQQAQSIFDAERESAKPLMQQIRTVRQSLNGAITGGNTNVDQLSTQLGTLVGQLAAIHTKSLAQFFAILTPDQQTKAQAILPRFARGPMGGRF